MRTRQKWMRLLSCMILGGTLSVGIAWATDPTVGFTGNFLVNRVTFDEIQVRADGVPPGVGGNEKDLWFAMQMTKGRSDLYVLENVWQPGASTGWHTHPGYSLIIVTQGKITAYDGDDPSCTGHTFEAGAGGTLIDANHIHNVRNDDPSVEARAYVVQIGPEGAPRKNGVPNPFPGNPNCPP